MRKIIAIAGVPGTGKSTLVNMFLSQISGWKTVTPEPLLNALYCEDLDLYVLGKYETGETFPGTDKLSMAVQPAAEKFIRESTSNFLFEGDRLTNMKFYDFLINLPDTDVEFIILKADEGTLVERYVERGSDQSEQFLRGRATKIRNIESNMDYWDYIRTVKNTNPTEQENILMHLYTAWI